MPSIADSKACFWRMAKKILAKSALGRSPVSRRLGCQQGTISNRHVKGYSTLHVPEKGSNNADEPGWTSDLGEDLEEEFV